MKFTLPAWYTASPANQGVNDAVDSDNVGGFSQCVTLTSGESNLTVDAGAYVPSQLRVVKTPDGWTFVQGAQVSYQIVVSNPAPAGSQSATNVMLNDALPGNGGLVWATATPTQGTCSAIVGNSLSCALGTLAPGASATVTVTSTATTPLNACRSQPNPAAIATADGGLTAQDNGSLSCTPPPPQLRVVKTPDGGTFAQGAQVSYQIVVSNPAAAGSQSATNVMLNDALPGNGGLVWATATPTQGTCSAIVGNSLSCALGTLAAGASATVTVTSTATTPLNACQSQPNPAAIATAAGGLTAQDSGSLSCTPPPPVCTGTIGDFVFYDQNLNGIQDSGEPGIAGVEVKLTNPDTTMVTTATDSMGKYLFTGLCAGTYSVIAKSPTGFVSTLTEVGSDRTVDSNPTPSTVVLPTDSSTDITVDFGFVHGLELCPPAGTTGPTSAGFLYWGVDVNGDVYVRYNQSRQINDNTDGVNAIGWGTKGHTFSNLTGSDKAEFKFTAAGSTSVALDFFLDYITAKAGTPSGYASLGPDGGDGSMVSGTRANLLSWNTSLAKNLNNTGFCVGLNCTYSGTNLLVDSPAADANCNVTNAAFAAWNFTNAYEMKISHLAFGSAGFGAVSVGLIHNSPPKSGTDAFTPGMCGTSGGGGGFATYTQGGWGAKPSGNNPGTLLKNNFPTVYPSGVTIGGGKTLKFTTAKAIETFLPQGGKPAVLKVSATDPKDSAAGEFAGQVLSLRLSVDFSAAGVTKTGLGSLTVVSGKLAGYTVTQVLALANAVLGGNTGALPSGMSISDLNKVVDAINNNFDGGTANNGYLQ